MKRAAIALLGAVLLSISMLLPPFTLSVEAEYVEKECMPDFGQHSSGWCWVTAAANSFYWFAKHGYPKLLDDPGTPGPDNLYETQIIPKAGCPSPEGGYRRLLQEICDSTWHDNDGDGVRDEDEPGYEFCNPVATNHDYLCGLRAFLKKQGVALVVQEEWGATFDDYKHLLKECEDVILWLEDYAGPELNHYVTGVSYDDVKMEIRVSDPWTPGAPDHNNNPAKKLYDTWNVVTVSPFVISPQEDVPGGPKQGQNINVGKIIWLSPAKQLEVFKDSTSFHGEGEAMISKTIVDKNIAIEVEELIDGVGTWEFDSYQKLDEGADTENGEANYEGSKKIDFEGDGLAMMQRAESVGFHGGISASVMEIVNATALQKEETVRIVTTAPVDSWQSLSLESQARVVGMLGVLGEWSEICAKDIVIEEMWDGTFAIEKTLGFEELVSE